VKTVYLQYVFYKQIMTLLKDLVNIKAGYTFRGKIQNELNADTAIIKLKDIDYNHNLINTPSIFKNSKKFKSNHFLKQNDILFIAKGFRQVAVIYSSKEKAIASSVFFIITVKNKKLLPEYLMWFLNNKETQAIFEKMKSGTSTQNIKKEILEDLIIKLPSKQKQNIIVKYNNLCRKEYIITEEIINKKKALNEQLMLNYINK